MFTLNHFIQQVSFLSLIRNCSNFSKSNLKKLLEIMPKEPTHVIQAQKQRMKIKEKFQKYVPGKVTLQVLGTGAEGAPKSLYMFTDQSRYLFNCGEGTQRLAHEHKMKLSKLEHIFITHPTWGNIGGLPGVSLTIQDVGVPQITLHGPEGLVCRARLISGEYLKDELFIATRRFVVLKNLTVKMAECTPSQQFEDNVMKVTYVPISRSDTLDTVEMDDDNENEKSIQISEEKMDAGTSTRSEKKHRHHRRRPMSYNPEISDDDTDYYDHESKPRGRRRHRSRSRNRRRARSVSVGRPMEPKLPAYLIHENRDQRISMCYICRLQPRPGALSLEKCVEAGVPPGPLLGQLKSGKDITLDSGVVVKSKDVCLPDDPGPVLIIVDCPNSDYLDSLVHTKIFANHQSTAKHDDDLAYIVVHFTPPEVMNDLRYKKWVDKFSPSTQHLVLNESNTCMGSIAVHRIQYKLNMLNEDMFPLLGDSGTTISDEKRRSRSPAPKKIKTDEKSCATTTNMEKLSVDNSFVYPGTFCNVYLRPKKGLDRSDELHLVPSDYIDETMSIEGFPEVLQHLQSQLTQNHKKEVVIDYPRILFLGTGSCIPNKTRNTSSILVKVSENASFLMDCGEGSYGQLVRFYGSEQVKKILVNLKAVYISHLHADHHIGLVGLLKGRRKAFQSLNLPFEPLMLLAPRQILFWLSFYHRRFEEIAENYELIANGDMILGDNKLNYDQTRLLKKSLGFNEVQTVLVRHCPNAFGVSFTHEDGWKLTYSGDTMPSDKLIFLGMNSDILIHEATMEDELAHEAVTKMHSTTSQAIEIGKRMKAKHILLTHFSQRYAKLPRFNDNFSENVGIAFDNMQVRLNDLPLVPLLYPALRLMFAEHYEELEHKAVKRQLKQERGVSLERPCH